MVIILWGNPAITTIAHATFMKTAVNAIILMEQSNVWGLLVGLDMATIARM